MNDDDQTLETSGIKKPDLQVITDEIQQAYTDSNAYGGAWRKRAHGGYANGRIRPLTVAAWAPFGGKKPQDITRGTVAVIHGYVSFPPSFRNTSRSRSQRFGHRKSRQKASGRSYPAANPV
jgi:hypothetical protein